MPSHRHRRLFRVVPFTLALYACGSGRSPVFPSSAGAEAPDLGSRANNTGNVGGDTVGRDKIVIIAPTFDDGPAIDAGIDAAALQNSIVGHYEGVSVISDGGAVVSGTLDIKFTNTGPGTATLQFDLHGDCANSLLVAAVFPTVIATVYGGTGNVISQVRVDVDKTPGRGSPFNDPTHRGHNNSVTIATDPYVLPPIREVKFQMFDRGP